MGGMKTPQANEELLPLDNSAVIYPPTVARYNSHTFRISMDLTVPVIPTRLLTAAEHILERFPFFAVTLHQGFYWYYFMPNKNPLEVYPEISSPCAYIHPKKGANGYLFKILYTEQRIAIEFFHALTDGTGALVFLKSLVAEYLRLSGREIGEDPQVLLANSKMDPLEAEDSFERYYTPRKSVFGSESSAYHLPSSGGLTDKVQVISARIKIEDLKKISSFHQVTITEYLVAELLDAMQRVQEAKVKNPKKFKPVRISVPVNIRKIFGSKSLRNFTLFVVVGIDVRLGHYEFEEILEQVMHQLRASINAKTLGRQVTRNVAGRRHPLMRYAPNVFKRPLMKLLSDTYGDGIYSTTLSNIGNVTLPSGMHEVVDRLDFFLSPSKKNKTSCAAVGANGYLTLNFTSILAERTDFEREALSALVTKGIPVEVATNRTIQKD